MAHFSNFRRPPARRAAAPHEKFRGQIHPEAKRIAWELLIEAASELAGAHWQEDPPAPAAEAEEQLAAHQLSQYAGVTPIADCVSYGAIAVGVRAAARKVRRGDPHDCGSH
jgi:hypothetical protein